MSRSLLGSVYTTWKYGTGNSSASRSASHRCDAAAWHFGQCRLRQELYAICVWPHAASSQRATYPPSAAVRQRSIAVITFNWSRLMCPLLVSRQQDRDRGECPRLPELVEPWPAALQRRRLLGVVPRTLAARPAQAIEWALDLGNYPGRNAGIAGRRLQLLVS